MYNRREESRQDKIDNKLKEAISARQKAMDKRVKELEK